MKLVMASNPSHLESVNGVVLGRCRAPAAWPTTRKNAHASCLLLDHGDAAVISQGAVGETPEPPSSKAIGSAVASRGDQQPIVTTARKTPARAKQCTDITLMMIRGPVTSTARTGGGHHGQIAMEYRQQVRRDIFIDLVCHRKYGRNEQDEASFMQPHLTTLVQRQQEKIGAIKNSRSRTSVLTPADVQAMSRPHEPSRNGAEDGPYRAMRPGDRARGWRWEGIWTIPAFDPVQTGVTP